MNKKFRFKKFIYALAPMAGVTDFAFREICSDLGADLVVSEMISAKALEYNNNRTKKMLTETSSPTPTIPTSKSFIGIPSKVSILVISIHIAFVTKLLAFSSS